jgi:predicted nuclease with TOPRIM domain
MSSGALRKALSHTAVGVVWRLAVFGLVALCFVTLIQLRHWYTRYAPSKEWAKAAESEKLPWSSQVAEAARALSSTTTVGTYPSQEIFYKAILRQIRKHPRLAKDEMVGVYRAHRKEREKLENALQKRTEVQDEFEQKSLRLSTKAGEVAELDATIERLEDIKHRDSAQEKELKEAQDRLQENQKKILVLREEVQEAITRRDAIETGFQRRLAVLRSHIEEEEQGIKEAFNAVSAPARPAQGLSNDFQRFALQVGDESDPRHIVYLTAWYGLEAAIVILLCAVLVPWLIRFGGNASDPKEVHSKVTEKIKELLAKAFGERAVAGAVKALAITAVGGAAAAGVALAAGDQPSILPPIRHDITIVAGAKGDPGEPGGPGKDGKDGINGTNGTNGGDGKCDQCSTTDVTDLRSQLEKQARLIEELKGELKNVEEKANKNSEEVLRLNGDVEIAKKNMDGLSNGMASLDKGMSSLSGSIGGLYSANQSILQLSDATRQQVLGSLYRLENENLSTTSQVQTVRKTVDQAAKDVPPLASDVLWMNAVPDSAWARVSPFRRYEVTSRVRADVERAMKGVDENHKVEKDLILETLRLLEKQGRLGNRRFRNFLWNNCPSAAHDILRQWEPLIVKLSRVQEQHHG